MSPSQPRSRFIDDLIPLILECHDHWWPRDLVRLSVVSAAWLVSSRKRLYERPSLRSFRACSQLARSLKQNPSLQSLLKGIDIRPFVGSNTNEGVLLAGEMESLRFILSLGGLKSVTLGGELAVGAQRFLNMMTNPDAVTELYIDGNLLNVGNSYLRRRKPASFEWDEVIAFKFHNLRKLKLSNLELDITFPSIPYELCISDIIIDNVEITNGYLHQLLNESWASLRHLDVVAKTATEFDEQMRLILDYCGPTLEFLHYDVRDSHSTEPLFDFDSVPSPSLLQLSLGGVELDFDTLASIGQCCRNLQELSITGRSVSVTPDQWVSFLNSGALPSLKTLITPWATKYPPFTRWTDAAGNTVQKASEARAINLPLNEASKPLG
jgi:hypothetical protein